jgi:hypothetical protein
MSTADHHLLDPVEGVPVDDRRLDDLVRPQPLGGVVPPQLGGVAEGDVFDVDEHFVFALLVPRLVAGVAGLMRIARTANLFHAMPERCLFRSGSWADGLGMPSRVRPSAMA